MNIFLFGLLALLCDETSSQHLITCPDNECWCCPFGGGACFNEDEPCCCETQESYPCPEVEQCCETGTTCCEEGGCCPDGTWCCEEGLCCYDQPYILQAMCVPSDRWLEPEKTQSLLKQNLTAGTCSKPNCFCCCEGLVCPTQESGSTESCIEKSEAIDIYCQEMGACPEDARMQKTVGSYSKKLKEKLSLQKNINKTPSVAAVIDMAYITQIRSAFYEAATGGGKNFQFAVFKFGPAGSDWDPPLNGMQVDWTDELVVQEAPNNWQASRYSSCADGCHTEAVILGDVTPTSFDHMLANECAQTERPLTLNVYSFYSYCSTAGGSPGCQELVQDRISSFFGSTEGHPCNTYEWVINVVWTMQYRDQSGEDCSVGWGDWAGTMIEDHANVKVYFGVQSVGTLATLSEGKLASTRQSIFGHGYLKIALACACFCALVCFLKSKCSL